MAENLVIDLTTYKDRMGSRVAEGKYRVVIEDAELDKARSGNTMINLWYRILDGKFQGVTLVDRVTMTEKAMFRVVGLMQAIGLDTGKKKHKLNLDRFIGKTLMVNVEDGDPYNGRIRSEVRGYERAEVVEKPKPEMDEDDLDDEYETEEVVEETEEVTDDPTDYDEDEEPQKAKAAAAKKKKKAKKPEPEPEDEDDDEDVDLNDIDEM